MVSRAGHSLPELVVALVFIAVALAAITSGTLLAYRSTAAAVRRQDATVLTAALLDSLLAASHVADDHRVAGGIRTEWAVSPAVGGLVVELRATGALGGEELARLVGFWLPLPPVLPAGAGPVGAAGDAP